jgi:hypothetical protein
MDGAGFDGKQRIQQIWRVYGVRSLIVGGLLLWIWLLGPRMLKLLRMRQRVRKVRRGEGEVADATLLYGRLLELLRSRGYQKPGWFTPYEFARSLPDPELVERVDEFTRAYNAVRFGGRREMAARLSVLLEELEQRAG